ncbi:iron-sulfur cluster assembly 2 homolog, mitochondrial [Hydra vulgaris]|uniref:Iron-sulfur cluster assembly 2 homolog, mitochondrial n=1 Tax=Hydra vulgaris TaxID=6087 RepID=T2MAG7_HYDVU|nr:iron-sulfur cluster assembly 2 homolog, mitochondrial [Hydra vulgaris]
MFKLTQRTFKSFEWLLIKKPSQRLCSVLSQVPSLNIDNSCVERLKSIISNDNFLRVLVEGGGCSGFQYKFEIDNKIDPAEDMVFEKDNAKVVADKESVKILNGATIEYHTDLIRAGFRVSNIPKAEKSCSCGVSFSIKL